MDEVLPAPRLFILGLQHLFMATVIQSAGIVAVSLAAGLLPAVQPNFYEHFPSDFQVIFGSSITSTVIVVFTLNLVFNHWTRLRRRWRRIPGGPHA